MVAATSVCVPAQGTCQNQVAIAAGPPIASGAAGAGAVAPPATTAGTGVAAAGAMVAAAGLRVSSVVTGGPMGTPITTGPATWRPLRKVAIM